MRSTPSSASRCARGDLAGAYAGVRPLISSGDSRRSVDISRKAELYETSSGMLTITGGKLTTWRRMAKQVVDRLVEREGRECPLPHRRDTAWACRLAPRTSRRPRGSGRARSPSWRFATGTLPAASFSSPATIAAWRGRSSPSCPTSWPRRRSRRDSSRPKRRRCAVAAHPLGDSRRDEAAQRRVGATGR